MHFVPSTADDAILNVRRSAAGAIILNFQPSLYALRMKIMPAPLFLRVRDDVVFFVWFRADRARIHFPSSRIQYKTLCDHYHRAVGRAILRCRFRPAFFVREDQRFCVRRRRLRRGTVRVDLRGGSSSGESIGIFIAALITFAVANERDTIFALLISSNRMETSLLDELRRGAALSDRGLPRRRYSPPMASRHAHHAQTTRRPQQVQTKK